ncbi:hypothetical protein QQM39_41030 [Streptomyces sp. DT2A-34]|nr:hypothetical protein [Streptomyces sp. DT2A-34]MDO0916964.1 hypothetical protein [Streptomyces sp. DT2A-34]
MDDKVGLPLRLNSTSSMSSFAAGSALRKDGTAQAKAAARSSSYRD